MGLADVVTAGLARATVSGIAAPDLAVIKWQSSFKRAQRYIRLQLFSSTLE
jgi:hypothetical protein